MNASQAADYLGISSRAVYALAAPAGPIPCARIGRRVVFEQADLRSALTQQAEQAHRQGCDALGGYGNGIGPCTCGAQPSGEVLTDADPPSFDWRTTPIMSPYSRPGTRVVFMGINGHDWQKAEARKLLKVGEVYIVRRTEVHSAHTDVWLEGFDTDFNSVHFTPAESATLAKIGAKP